MSLPQKVENVREINLDDIKPSNFVDTNKWSAILEKLKEVKYYIDEELRIIENNPNVPSSLVDLVNKEANVLVQFLYEVEDKRLNNDPIQAANFKRDLLINIENWCKKCVNIQTNTPNVFLTTFTVIIGFDNSLKLNLDKLENLEDEIKNLMNDKVNESEEMLNATRANSSTIEDILKELQKKTAEITVSDYANVFKIQAEKYNFESYIWLIIGVIISIIFVCLIVFGVYKNIPTEEIITSKGVELVKYNFGNLLIKVLVFAIQIFLISFSFKQFSINKHLSTINKHRQNGFNSFKLFVDSVSKDDNATRNSLMLQLSKAVYEQSTTGYISDKNSNINSSILEITKMISSNKTE